MAIVRRNVSNFIMLTDVFRLNGVTNSLGTNIFVYRTTNNDVVVTGFVLSLSRKELISSTSLAINKSLRLSVKKI